ncbi:hypothetical protein [Caulobacter sp.]|jgi:hypothetical protein|uniref:hypothetical protein n=1 Tax=Caulobacter sp. TaxID=78 RepID=UPI0018045FC2
MMAKTPKPPHTGNGELTIARQAHPVAFSLHYLDNRGQRSAKGGLTGSPDVMRDAFREGRVHLALDDGKGFDVSIIAHAEGSPTAYFESATSLR